MNRKRLFYLLSILLLCSLYGCKTNRTINHQREGKWVYKDSINDVFYKSKGRYKRSSEINTWKYFENRKLIKTESYQDSICHIRTFNTNGKVTSVGQSMISEEKDGTHWYFNGDWIFFDDNGKIIGIKKYQKGGLVSEVKM